MTSVPLHPALVHLPLGLAFIIPALAIALAWAWWTDRGHAAAWTGLVVLQALLLGAGIVAMKSGEREEERVERIVPDAALEQHEEYAEQFVWATGGTLVLAGLVLVSRKRSVARSLTVATAIGTVVVAAAAIRVGHAGGRLVYVHNAGAAYAAVGQQTPNDGPSGAAEHARHADEDR